MTQSADLPVRPCGTEPAEPALAARGAPPDAPAAAPARELLRLVGIALLWTAVPAAAAGPVASAQHHHCHKHAGQVAAAVPARKPAASTTVVLKNEGGGYGHWQRIAADLMP